MMTQSELLSIDPSTGAIFWRSPVSDVNAEVAMAQTAWPQWAQRDEAERMAVLRRFADLVRDQKEGFARLIAQETGKPYWEACTEVDAVVNKVEISARAFAERTPTRQIDASATGQTILRHRPHGVMAVLGPYNFPAHLPNGHIVPALMAGNTIVFKPSEKTPASGAMLVDLFHEAGVPEGALRLVIGGVAEGKALVAHPAIDGILFTGSARTGTLLNRQFADQPGKMLALEMGGNNPIIAWHPDDSEAAATLIVQSAYLSAGQRCTAASRLIVPETGHEALIDAVCHIMDRLIIDAPMAEPAPFMGPVIDNEAADALEQSFGQLVALGGRVIRPLTRVTPGLPYLSPALIDMTDASERPDEELFGPVLQMVRVPDFETAIKEANATRFGLAASLIGGTKADFETYRLRARAGVVNWNKPTNGAPSAAPFGGLGLSGNHRPSAYYAADYCAYPVVSLEENAPKAVIATGLR